MYRKIKSYFENMANPLLYYIDKNGNSVFRNFCLFKNNGNAYNRVIQVKDAGEIIEYRIDTEKKIRSLSLLFLIIAYLIYINFMYNFLGLIFCELLFIGCIFATKIHYNAKFSNILLSTYGQYSVVDFSPSITPEKKAEYKRNYTTKIAVILLSILIFISFSYVLNGSIRYFANKTKPDYNKAVNIAKIYSAIYPKTSLIYEIKAYKDYADGNFDHAVSNYLHVFDLCGKKFTDKDYSRFANLLYMVKKSTGSQDAIDIFNEYSTKKKTTLEQKIKLLWIKSMFSTANGLTEFIYKDYEDLLESLDNNDILDRYYILNDEAYMLYLSKDYRSALHIYNELIPMASENNDLVKDLPRLYIERGYTKRVLRDSSGANSDFINSNIERNDILKYEPKISEPEFINYKL